jgi:uncharacterized protein (TIGR03000 family)
VEARSTKPKEIKAMTTRNHPWLWAVLGTLLAAGALTAAPIGQPPRIQPQPTPPRILPQPIRPDPGIPTDPTCRPPWWWNRYPPYYPYPVFPPVVVIPTTVPVGVPQPATAAAVDTPQTVRGMIQVLLPDAKAEVALNGKPIPGLGVKRWLNTADQAAGQTYRYELTASWPRGGETVTETQTVSVAAGQYGFVDFTRPAPAGN